MRFNKILPLFLLVACLGCFSVPVYDRSPAIEFADIQNFLRIDERSGGYKDSVVISVRFRDGDGDLGYDSWEIDSLKKKGVASNFIVTQYRKNKGKYEVFTPVEPYDEFFHRLSGDKPGPIEGVIHYSGIQVYHSFYPYPKDTVKFEISIRDRLGNLSNKVMTDSVVIRPI